jgi:glucokinase
MRLSPDALVRLVVACVREVEAAAGVRGLPVGVGSIGQIHRETGRILGTTADYEEYIGFLLRDRLAAALSATVWLDNDAKVAGLGELRCGAGRLYRHLVYFGLGTGIGGAVFVDGRLAHGAAGLAGHLGVISVDWRGPIFPSRTPGPIEGYASGTGIARLGREHGLGDEDRRLTSEEVFAAAVAGDSRAQAAISDAARALGVAITSVLYVLNPEAVVIGGGVAQVGEPFLAQVRGYVAEFAMPEFARTPILPAALGADSGLVGAALQVWEE